MDDKQAAYAKLTALFKKADIGRPQPADVLLTRPDVVSSLTHTLERACINDEERLQYL
jgi:hypothetical protein